MILPNKHVDPKRSLIGIGAAILQMLDRPRSLSSVWDRIRERPEVITFERFTLALCFLYAVGAIEWEAGRFRRQRS
jgi:hypothetical protein